MSRASHPPPCATCGDKKPEAVCDWPVDGVLKIKPLALRVGDVMEYGDLKLEVLGIKLRAHRVGVYFRRPDGYTFLTHIRASQWLKVERSGKCGQACCFRHRRHVDDKRDYCEEHWNAWQQVA